jgi:hypothetical protein
MELMKYIEIEKEMDKNLHTLCDWALKAGGMQVFGLINQLLASIKEDLNPPSAQ